MSACGRSEDVALYVGGDLSAEESAAVQQHAMECGACRELLADLMVDAALLRAPVVVPEAAYAEVRRAVDKRLHPSRRCLWWPAAAAVAAAMASAVWYQRERNRPLERMEIAVAAPSAPAPALPMDRPHRAATARKRTDPTRLAMALRAMLPPTNAAPAANNSPVFITTQTEDPNVVIILIPETRGDTHD